MGWFIYFGVILAASLVLGRHLGKFRSVCNEMTGMMAGMTVGMLGGFALGYGMSAALGRDLFAGNLVGVMSGAVLGGWFGRAGNLMGIMDGAMGGVMGGSMGAMIAAMIYPDWQLQWTGALFGGIYIMGALALTVLIESRTPDHAHIHRLLPWLTKIQPNRRTDLSISPANISRANREQVTPMPPPVRDYYAMLNIANNAGPAEVEEAYLSLLATADEATLEQADPALTILRDPARRARYDAILQESYSRQEAAAHLASSPSEPGDCCPPPKRVAAAATSDAAGVNVSNSRQSHSANNGAPRKKSAAKGEHDVPRVAQGNARPGKGPSVTAAQAKQRAHHRVQQDDSVGRRIATGAGVGAVVMLLVFAIAFSLSKNPGNQVAQASYNNPTGAVYHAPGAVPSEAQLESEAVAAVVGADGVQTADLVLDETTSSYSPAAIKVRKGVPVRINISTTGAGTDCRSVVEIPALGARGYIDGTQPGTMDFTPPQAGIYEFNCPMHMVSPSYLWVTN